MFSSLCRVDPKPTSDTDVRFVCRSIAACVCLVWLCILLVMCNIICSGAASSVLTRFADARRIARALFFSFVDSTRGSADIACFRHAIHGWLLVCSKDWSLLGVAVLSHLGLGLRHCIQSPTAFGVVVLRYIISPRLTFRWCLCRKGLLGL